MKEIYLASASPRRLQLLRQIGIEPKVMAVDYDEDMISDVSSEQIAIDNAVGKAKAASQIISTRKSLIIAADTIVVYDNKILGKPVFKQEAYNMLNMLSGDSHYVVTGVCVYSCESNEHICTAVKTLVEMREIDHKEIEAYINTAEPYDKAGAYGIQQLAGLFVKRIAGSYSNVVGLPIQTVGEMLKKFNFEVTTQWQKER